MELDLSIVEVGGYECVRIQKFFPEEAEFIQALLAMYWSPAEDALSWVARKGFSDSVQKRRVRW